MAKKKDQSAKPKRKSLSAKKLIAKVHADAEHLGMRISEIKRTGTPNEKALAEAISIILETLAMLGIQRKLLRSQTAT